MTSAFLIMAMQLACLPPPTELTHLELEVEGSLFQGTSEAQELAYQGRWTTPSGSERYGLTQDPQSQGYLLPTWVNQDRSDLGTGALAFTGATTQSPFRAGPVGLSPRLQLEDQWTLGEAELVIEDISLDRGRLVLHGALSGEYWLQWTEDQGMVSHQGSYQGQVQLSEDCAVSLPQGICATAPWEDEDQELTQAGEPSGDCPDGLLATVHAAGEHQLYDGHRLSSGAEDLLCEPWWGDHHMCFLALDDLEADGCTWDLRAWGWPGALNIAGFSDGECEVSSCNSAVSWE